MSQTPRSRRSVLQFTGVATLFALAGCVQTDQSEGTTSTTAETTHPTASTERTTSEPASLEIGGTATVSDGSVTVQAVRTERSIVVLDGSSHTKVVTEENSQFVVVSLKTQGNIDGVDAGRQAVRLVIDGQPYSVADYAFPPQGDAFDVAFQVPLDIDPNESELRWVEDNHVAAVWSTPPSVIHQLTSPPEFDVVSFTVPETVEPFVEFDVAVEVDNTGDGDGTFVAELGLASRSDQSTFQFDVPKNTRGTEVEEKQVQGEPGGQETMILDWGLGRLERTIDIVEG